MIFVRLHSFKGPFNLDLNESWDRGQPLRKHSTGLLGSSISLCELRNPNQGISCAQICRIASNRALGRKLRFTILKVEMYPSTAGIELTTSPLYDTLTLNASWQPLYSFVQVFVTCDSHVQLLTFWGDMLLRQIRILSLTKCRLSRVSIIAAW